MKLVVAPAWASVAAVVEDPATSEILAGAFGPLASTTSAEGHGPAPTVVHVRRGPDVDVVIEKEGSAVACPSGMPAAVCVATEINQHLLAKCPHLAMHAGVLGAHGMAIAVPAESGWGKSTLTAACLKTGFEYVSDEALALDPRGLVIPHPRPIGLSTWSRAAVGVSGVTRGTAADIDEELIDPRTLGRVVPLAERVPLGAVVILRPGRRQEPSLRPIAPSAAVISLLGNCFNHYANPTRAVDQITSVVRRAKVLELELGSPAATAALLARQFLA